MSSPLTGLPGGSSLLAVQSGATQAGGFALARAQDADRLREAHDTAKAAYTHQQARLDKTTKDFEAVFVGMMLKQMRKSMAGTNALFDNSPTSKTYQEMLDENVAQRISHSGGIGLAKMLYHTMSKTLPPNPDVTLESVKTEPVKMQALNMESVPTETIKTEAVTKR